MNDIFKNPHDTCKSFLFYNTEKKYQKKNLWSDIINCSPTVTEKCTSKAYDI